MDFTHEGITTRRPRHDLYVILGDDATGELAALDGYCSARLDLIAPCSDSASPPTIGRSGSERPPSRTLCQGSVKASVRPGVERLDAPPRRGAAQ